MTKRMMSYEMDSTVYVDDDSSTISKSESVIVA